MKHVCYTTIANDEEMEKPETRDTFTQFITHMNNNPTQAITALRYLRKNWLHGSKTMLIIKNGLRRVVYNAKGHTLIILRESMAKVRDNIFPCSICGVRTREFLASNNVHKKHSCVGIRANSVVRVLCKKCITITKLVDKVLEGTIFQQVCPLCVSIRRKKVKHSKV